MEDCFQLAYGNKQGSIVLKGPPVGLWLSTPVFPCHSERLIPYGSQTCVKIGHLNKYIQTHIPGVFHPSLFPQTCLLFRAFRIIPF